MKLWNNYEEILEKVWKNNHLLRTNFWDIWTNIFWNVRTNFWKNLRKHVRKIWNYLRKILVKQWRNFGVILHLIEIILEIWEMILKIRLRRFKLFNSAILLHTSLFDRVSSVYFIRRVFEAPRYTQFYKLQLIELLIDREYFLYLHSFKTGLRLCNFIENFTKFFKFLQNFHEKFL